MQIGTGGRNSFKGLRSSVSKIMTVKQAELQKQSTFSAKMDQPINRTSSQCICPHISFCESTACAGQNVTVSNG